jgi:predicted secreted Zn-dependent protease
MRQSQRIVASALGLLVAASGCSTTSEPGQTAGTVSVSPRVVSTQSVDPSAAPPPPVVRARDIQPSGDVQVIDQRVRYEIAGITADQLAAQIKQLGPTDPENRGGSFTGYARTRFAWDVDESVALGAKRERCMIESVDIYLDVWITLPRWEPPASASQALIAEWGRYLERLRIHELGHKEIARRLAKEAARATKGLIGPCGVVHERADERIEKILGREDALQEAYDRSTRHGATQGAYLTLSV